MAEIDAFKLSELKKSEQETIAANAAAATFVKKDPVTNKVTQYTPTTEEYYKSLGGIDRKTGAYGYAVKAAEEQFRPYLTYEEQAVVTEGLTGVARGQAINLATAKKQYDLAISRGLNPAEAAEFSGYDPVTNSIKFVSPPGNTGGTGNTGSTDSAATDALLAFNKSQAAAELQSKRESAFGVLKKEFDKYGLGSLVDSVKNLILTGSSPEEVVLRLRETPEYLKRFAGNKLRLDAGLNVYDEATYLDLENAYDQIFTSYGVEEAVGNTRAARQAKYAEFIGGTKSPDEIKGRVQLAVLASQEDAVTKATMKELYPMLTDKDLVSYFLNPKETLPKLETKIRAAQVGAAAVRQGLVTNVATAEELVGLGVTEEEAERAYSAYAYDKPRIDLLSGLDPTKDNLVNQQVAEGALLKNLASEQRKLDLLKQKELGRFGGASGVTKGVSLSKQLGGTY